MSHTYAHNLMHCVFSTKERLHLIRDPESLWRYTVGLAYQKKVHVVSAGGTTNHAHLLVLVPQTLPLAKVMQRDQGKHLAMAPRNIRCVSVATEGYGSVQC